jgi:hypothetical protein
MGHLRIIHVRLGVISGFMSDIAPCVKSAGSGNGPVTMDHRDGSILEQRDGNATSNREFWCTVIQQA